MRTINYAWLRASQAIRIIESFDDVFPKRIPNHCGCQVGAMNPTKIDYNNLLNDLHLFYESFSTPVQACEVNHFLGLNEKRRRSTTLLANDKVLGVSAGKHLTKLRDDAKWITCTECMRIGDAIIALEQPGSWCLVHLDRSFDVLSETLGRPHLRIKSVAALNAERLATLEAKGF